MSAWPRSSRWIKAAPFALMVLGLLVLLAFGLPQILSLENLRAHRDAVAGFADARPLAAALIFFGIYLLAALTLMPGVLWLTIGAAFFLGGWTAGGVSWAAGLIGAGAVFLAARGALEPLAMRTAGKWLERFRAGFQANDFAYLLALRILPLAPFAMVNIAPALLGMRLRRYLAATAIGNIPGIVVYSAIGQGLADALDAKTVLAALTRPELIAGFVGAALLVLAPVLWRLWKQRR